MDFKEYQEQAKKTAIYPAQGNNLSYPALGLTGEAGEVADKVKKVIRDKGGVLSPEDSFDIAAELGDVLWYVATLATELGWDLERVAVENIEKLDSRKKRDKLHGSGDNR